MANLFNLSSLVTRSFGGARPLGSTVTTNGVTHCVTMNVTERSGTGGGMRASKRDRDDDDGGTVSEEDAAADAAAARRDAEEEADLAATHGLHFPSPP